MGQNKFITLILWDYIYIHTHTHTHTHIYIYIYIYIYIFLAGQAKIFYLYRTYHSFEKLSLITYKARNTEHKN